MRASSKVEGERLMMVSHFLIVGSSLAISFIDLLGRSFGGGKSGGMSEQEMEAVQGFFGRIGTRQVDRGVLLSFHLNEDETQKFVAKAKVKIAGEKKARGVRLEREALASFIDTIKKGDTAGVTAYLAKQINVNGKDAAGNMPLHTASATGKIDIVRLLVEKGAKIDVPDYDMKTPLHRAVESGNLETVEYILGRGGSVRAKALGDITPLHDNAMQGNSRITELLLGKQAEMSAKTDMGDTPLHYAAENGHLEVVRVLVEKGADINAGNNNGQRAVDRAARMNKQDVVNYLNERGGSSQDSSGVQEQDHGQDQGSSSDDQGGYQGQ